MNLQLFFLEKTENNVFNSFANGSHDTQPLRDQIWVHKSAFVIIFFANSHTYTPPKYYMQWKKDLSLLFGKGENKI